MAKKRREIPAKWIRVDVSEVQEKIKSWTPTLTVNSGAKRALRIFFELIEFLKKHNLPTPNEGSIEPWWEIVNERWSRRDSRCDRPLDCTIASLVTAQDPEELSDATGITTKRLREIANGVEPMIAELSLLELGLDITLEELHEIYRQEFNGKKEKINGI